MDTITIDVSGKSIGRVSTRVAAILNGKHTPDYAPNKVPNVCVVLENIKSIQIPKKKQKQKTYFRHSTYLGGGKTQTMEEVIEKKGVEEVIRKSILGMIPKNRLQKEKIKRVSFA